MIKENLTDVNKLIDVAVEKSGRDRDTVTLIAVSKTKPVEMLEKAYECGIRDFGENKVQELVDKYEKLPKDIRWHLIGHLQTNKVKYIIDKAYLIHSVDSYKLAKEISKEAVKHSLTANILLEVNIAMEESKYGISPDELPDLVEEVSKLEGIQIKGLMIVPPFVKNSEENRKYFIKIRELAVDITNKNIDNVCMDILSMGMSGDFQVAIEEGASYIRVGTSIFGERNYNN